MAFLPEATIQRFSHGLRLNIRDVKTGGRIESGWLHATLQWRGGDDIFLLTGQHPEQPEAWTRIGTLDGFGFRPIGQFNQVQRRRAKLARTLLGTLQGLGYDDERYIISLETRCDRCEQRLGSNVMVRPNGRVLGPTCWEIESGEFARKRDERKARIDGFMARAASTITRKCNGTCDVNTHCNDCDGPR